MGKNKIISSIWHPFLLACYSVLALYAYNVGEVELTAIYRPIFLMILFSLLLLVVYHAIIKNWQVAGLLTTWSLFLFVTYGHFYNFFKVLPWLSILGHHRVLLPLWLVLFVVVALLVIKKIKSPASYSIILNAVSLLLVLFSTFSISRYFINKSSTESDLNESEEIPIIQLEMPQSPPDIYYLLLDGYARSDVLDQKFGFDNSGFEQHLRELGFFVANCSRSNYLYTHLALPSLLNMDYVDTLYAESPGESELDTFFLNYMSKNNLVMASLRSIGYDTVAFETSYAWAQFSEVDHFYRPVAANFFMLNITKFEEMYMDTTMLAALFDWNRFNAEDLMQYFVSPNVQEKVRIEVTLDRLKDVPEFEEPQFVFAHLMIPHPPYIFDENGAIPDLANYDESWEVGPSGQQRYLGNIRYINKEIIDVIREILSQSDTDPIIIIQSDHGTDFFDRSMNFSAFYFPGVGGDALYPSITPVNTFRLVFNKYFGTQLPRLPDVSYNGNYPLYEFVPIEESYPDCVQ